MGQLSASGGASFHSDVCLFDFRLWFGLKLEVWLERGLAWHLMCATAGHLMVKCIYFSSTFVIFNKIRLFLVEFQAIFFGSPGTFNVIRV